MNVTLIITKTDESQSEINGEFEALPRIGDQIMLNDGISYEVTYVTFLQGDGNKFHVNINLDQQID